MLLAGRLAVGVVRHRRGVVGAMPSSGPPPARPPLPSPPPPGSAPPLPPQAAPIGIHCATDTAAATLLSSASAALLAASATRAVHVYSPAESASAAAATAASAAAAPAAAAASLASATTTATTLAPFDPRTYHAALHTRSLGTVLLHTPVTGSTQDLLRAPPLGPALPSGAVAVADTQTGGRGRRSAVWESPAGGLAASVLLRVPAAAAATAATLVHLQYAAGLAVVAALRRVWRWPPGGVRVKWPNDVYVVSPGGAKADEGEGSGGGEEGGVGRGVKVGGVLVEATVRGGDVAAVVGLGVNVANAAPTTSLVAAAAAAGVDVIGGGGPALSREALLGATLTELERLADALAAGGWDTPGGVRAQYEAAWMHRGQRVALPHGVGGGGRRGVVRGLDAAGNICVAVDGGGVAKLDAATTSFDVLAGALREKAVGPRGGGGRGRP